MSHQNTPEEEETIQEAKQFVMEFYNVKESDAYRFLRNRAMHTRIPLATVARKILEINSANKR